MTNSLHLLRYRDLEEMQLVTSRSQLTHMVRSVAFPKGFQLSPQVRAWRASDIDEWIASRPTTQIKPRGRAKLIAAGEA